MVLVLNDFLVLDLLQATTIDLEELRTAGDGLRSEVLTLVALIQAVGPHSTALEMLGMSIPRFDTNETLSV